MAIETIQIDDRQSDLYNYTAKSNGDEKQSGYIDSSPQSQIQLPCGAKPKQPPPYHIAAVYSRGAHLFLNSVEKNEKEAEPKHFTQDQPLNILIPQPQHARCITQLQYENTCSYNNTDENIDYEGLQLNEIILLVASNLLRIDIEDPHCKCLIEQFLQFESTNNENKNTTSLPCHVLELKLQIFKITEYLMCCKEFVQLHRKYIFQVLDNLQENLDVVLAKPAMQPFVYSNEMSIESREKLTLIDIATILLGASYQNQDHYDLISQVLHIEKILPQNHSSENLSKIKPKTDLEAMIQAKLQLIKIVIYFVSTNNTDKEYKYIFGKFMQLHRRLQYLLKAQPVYQGMQTNSENQCLSDHMEIKNGTTMDNKYIKNGQRGNMNWVFGAHRNPKIIKVELTPCCYVLGFSVSHSEEGVFIDEVDQNGNAFQKLFTGDKILMLDDRDISKMDPEEALKSVQVWGPETEIFLISRN